MGAPPADSRGLDRFGLVLLLTSFNVVLVLLVERGEPDADLAETFWAIILSATTGATLLLALRAAGTTGRLRQAVVITTVVALAGLIGLTIAELVVSDASDRADVGPSSVLWGLTTLGTAAAILRRLLRHRTIRMATLYGAISVYLLLALSYTFAFTALDRYGSSPLLGTETSTTDHAYFSFVTITTLGYGDLSAQTSLGRLAAVSEAVIGQVYLVTVLAMIVGLLSDRRSTDLAAAEGSEAFDG